MIIVRVELHSAITGKVTELARARICNVGGTATKGDYECRTYRGRNRDALDLCNVQREGTVRNYPRLSIHVWHLVARALVAMGYAGKALQEQPSDMDAATCGAHPEIDGSCVCSKCNWRSFDQSKRPCNVGVAA